MYCSTVHSFCIYCTLTWHSKLLAKSSERLRAQHHYHGYALAINDVNLWWLNMVILGL
jgi:hypothetical protein